MRARIRQWWISIARAMVEPLGFRVVGGVRDAAALLAEANLRIVVGTHYQDALQRARGLLDFVDTQAHALGMAYMARKAFKEEIDKLGISLVRAYREVPGQAKPAVPPIASDATPTGPQLVAE